MSELRPQRVCIVGAGLRTVAGPNRARCFAALEGGLALFAKHASARDLVGERFLVAQTPETRDCSALEKWTRFASQTISEVLLPLPRQSDAFRLFGTVMLPRARPGLSIEIVESVRRAIESMVSIWGDVSSWRFVAVDEAEMVHEWNEARTRAADELDRVEIVCAIDCQVDGATLAWLDWNGKTYRSSRSPGRIPGDACAALAFASERLAATCGLEVLGRVSNVGEAVETSTGGSPGEALGDAVEQVWQPEFAEQRIEVLVSDDETHRDREAMGFFVACWNDRLHEVTSAIRPSSCWGHSGIAEMLVACVTAMELRAPRTIVLHKPGEKRIAVVLELSQRAET